MCSDLFGKHSSSSCCLSGTSSSKSFVSYFLFGRTQVWVRGVSQACKSLAFICAPWFLQPNTWFGFAVDCWSRKNPPLLFALRSSPGLCSPSSWHWLCLLILLRFASIQIARLPPSLQCVAANPFLCHPFFRFEGPGLIRHASSGQRTVIFPLPHQKACAASTKVGPHAQVPSNHLVVDLERGKWQLPIPSHPNFWRPCLFHPIISSPKAFLSSLCFRRLPQMQGRPMTFVFCLAQEWHPPLHASQSAKLSFHRDLLGKRKKNWPCCIAIDRTLCHSHHSHRLAFMIIGVHR